MVTFSQEHLLSYSCVTCGAKRFKPCVRLARGPLGGVSPHRNFCHVNRHHKALRAMREQA